MLRPSADLVLAMKQFDFTETGSLEAGKAYQRARELLKELNDDGQIANLIRPALRRLKPFALQAGGKSIARFLLVEDPSMLDYSPGLYPVVDRHAWSKGEQSGRPLGDPLIIYVSPLDMDVWPLLPQAYIVDDQDRPERPPVIFWNSGKDLTFSKFMHTSAQPFYLRRYVRRVAKLWEQDYERRPSVHALTQVSFNARPHQHLVDPNADLASVPVKRLSHNEWIVDLKPGRIPREKLDNPTHYSAVHR